MPKIEEVPSQDDEQPARIESSPRSRTVVLHGRVQHLQEDVKNDEARRNVSRAIARNRAKDQEYIRQRIQRQTEFTRLAYRTGQYQKVVAELTKLMEESGTTPSAAWRAKILMKSAQDSDKALWKQLRNYERTLLVRDQMDEEVRATQTECMKLHRDFNHSHKALVMALSLYEKRQSVSKLGGVGWSEDDLSEDEKEIESEDDKGPIDEMFQDKNVPSRPVKVATHLPEALQTKHEHDNETDIGIAPVGVATHLPEALQTKHEHDNETDIGIAGETKSDSDSDSATLPEVSRFACTDQDWGLSFLRSRWVSFDSDRRAWEEFFTSMKPGNPTQEEEKMVDSVPDTEDYMLTDGETVGSSVSDPVDYISVGEETAASAPDVSNSSPELTESSISTSSTAGYLVVGGLHYPMQFHTWPQVSRKYSF